MMKAESDQALPITAGLVATTAFFSMLWSFADGWMSQPGWESMALPGLFLDPNMRTVVSFFGKNFMLGNVLLKSLINSDCPYIVCFRFRN